MGRVESSRQYLMPRGGRCMSHMIGGAYQRPYRHVMPLSVSKGKLAHEDIGVRGMGTALLLSDTSLAQSKIIDGTGLGSGFGVKAPSKDLLKKLDNLSVGKKRKNVNMQL